MSYSKFNANQLMGQNKFETIPTQPPTTSSTTTTYLPLTPQLSSRRSSYNYDKQIEILEERIEEEIVELEDRRDRKYIVPLALKNPTEEPKRSPLFQESTPNIEDLKKHILMLQNLTKNDKNFQSKFVVFPNLQKNQSQSSGSSNVETQKSRTALNTPIQMALQSKNILRDSYEPKPQTEKITIIPQVILQNDQTPMTPEDYEMLNKKNKESGVRVTYSGRMNNRRNGQKKRKQLGKTTTIPTTTSTFIKTSTTTKTTTTSTTLPTPTPKQKRKKQRNIERMCTRNPNKKICQNLSSTPSTATTNLSYQKAQQQNSSVNNMSSTTSSSSSAILQRSSRSSSREQQQQQQKNKYSSQQSFHYVASTISPPPSSMGETNQNETMAMYKENIDLNPDLCYKVKGFSHGQQKLCALHTHIMPAISRGARSAIQVCSI